MSRLTYISEECIANGRLDQGLKEFYPESVLSVQRTRYQDLLHRLYTRFGQKSGVLAIAPGRIEICGNHTDHNHGHVLAAAVHMDVVCFATPAAEKTIVLESDVLPDLIVVDLAELAPVPDEEGKPEALVRGVVAGLHEAGYQIGGFQACTHSTVLIGSGLSSSAAFTVLIGRIISTLFNEGKIPAETLAKVAQKAENVYYGKPCGLMDQLASAVTGVLHIDFASHERPAVERINFDVQDSPYKLVIVDTGGNHADLTPEYAAIFHEMTRVAELLGRPNARALDEQQFILSIPRLRESVGDRAILRVMHFFDENARVLKMVEAMKKNDTSQFLKLVMESGSSSWRVLQNCYCATTPKEQGVPLGLELSRILLEGEGAWRIQGGGFAGTLQTYVPIQRLATFTAGMREVFGPACVTPIMSRMKAEMPVPSTT